MPELPEVENVKNVLEPQLTGRMIRGVPFLRPEIVAHPDTDAFVRGLRGRRIEAMRRRGKYLSLQLDDGAELVLHLRMTGFFFRVPADAPEEKHTHAVFSLDDGSELRYSDLRRFGRFWLLAPGEPDVCTGRDKLGPEPFAPELDSAYYQARLGGSGRAIKSCLLDQTVVAGLGNIYADESLYAARVAPFRSASSLTEAEWTRLAEAIPAVLREAVTTIAMTPEEYLAGKGQEYRNTPLLNAYGRAGQPCRRCGAPLNSRRIGGRTSCWCPVCQAEDAANAQAED